MSFVAAAIGGSALLGAGASIYSGSQMAGAAKDASAAQQDALSQANQTTIAAGRDALAMLDPFRQYGLNAGFSLQSAMYSPEQRTAQIENQRLSLQGEVDRLKSLAPKWESYPILTGKMASERRFSMFTQESNLAKQKIAEAQAKLDTFNKQAASMSAQGAGPSIEASPWYKFQADLLGRQMDRHFAARGLQGSGFEAEEKRRGLIELGAGETERQFGRMKGLYDVGANAANVGAGSLTGTAQSVSNNQIAAGQAQAQGIMGVAGANRDMVTGIANNINSNLGLYLGNKQWQQFASTLNSRNSPTPAKDPVFDSVDSGSGPYNYLRR